MPHAAGVAVALKPGGGVWVRVADDVTVEVAVEVRGNAVSGLYGQPACGRCEKESEIGSQHCETPKMWLQLMGSLTNLMLNSAQK